MLMEAIITTVTIFLITWLFYLKITDQITRDTHIIGLLLLMINQAIWLN